VNGVLPKPRHENSGRRDDERVEQHPLEAPLRPAPTVRWISRPAPWGPHGLYSREGGMRCESLPPLPPEMKASVFETCEQFKWTLAEIKRLDE
jgi:hypothetical protein